MNDSTDFLSAIDDALLKRRPPPDPATRDELRAALAEYPQLRHRWLPAAQSRELIDLRGDFGKEPEPLDERMRDSVLKSIVDDPATWGRALRFALTAAGEVRQ